MTQRRKLLFVVAVAFASASTAHAQAPVDVGGTFQQIEQAANAWIPAIMQEASFLFYVLALLDFAWGAPQLLREHDFNGLFLSLIKKLLVVSFFYAVLINGQVWIPAIVNSFAQLGATAAGVSVAQNPSDIMSQGLQIVSDLFTKVSCYKPPDGARRGHHDDSRCLHRACLLHHHHASLRCHQARSDYRDVGGLHLPWLRWEPVDFALF